MKLLAVLAAVAVVLVAVPAHADDLEGRVTADLAQWQVFAYGQAIGLAQVEQAVYDTQVQLGVYLGAVAEAEAAAAQQAQAAAEAARQAAVPAQPQPQAISQSSPRTSGGHSDAWWAAIAQCESGTTDTWAGYFGIIDGSAHGKSYADQLAQAKGIWASYGDGAWGCSPNAYAAVPGG